jgi:hypothetical protein
VARALFIVVAAVLLATTVARTLPVWRTLPSYQETTSRSSTELGTLMTSPQQESATT